MENSGNVESCERCQEQSVEGIKKVFTFIFFFPFVQWNEKEKRKRGRVKSHKSKKSPLLISVLSLQQFFCVKKSKDMLMTVKKRKAENSIKLKEGMARSEKEERNGNKNSDDILEKYR